MINAKDQSIRRIAMGIIGITAGCLLIILCGSILSELNLLSFMPIRGQFLAQGAIPPLSWHVDGLATFFIIAILLGQFLSSFYAWGYLKEFEGKKSISIFLIYWIIFLLSMYGVVVAGDGFTFLLMWEIMSLISFFLVLYEYEELSTRRAAFIYLVMTHVGTVFLTCAILFIYSKTGTFAFAKWGIVAQLPVWERNLIFLFFFIGLGTKAGMVPLHIWLPYAHSAAPTPVSALMSSVMVKIALYMFLRIFLISIGISVAWWGWLLLAVGVTSALIGILNAAVEGDIKRTLAYSTIENVGILTVSLGLVFLSYYYNKDTIMLSALVAFFWHLLNHLIFKSIMFMGAGNIIQATHVRRLELMGGLLKKLPKTGRYVLIAAVGLAALPPLGGFWGEFLLFSSLWEASVQMNDWSGVILPLFISVLGVVGAIAVATMVKWFGTIFLGQARSKNVQLAKEASVFQHGSMLIGIIISILILLWPFGLLKIINIPLQTLVVTSSRTTELARASTQLSNTLGTLSQLSISFIKYVFLLILFTYIIHFLNRGVPRKKVSTWNCGGDLTPRMQYSAAGVTMPIRILFKNILGSNPLIEKEFVGSKYFLRSLKYTGEIKAIFEDILYRPSKSSLLWLAEKIRFIQTGSIHLYLGYLLITIVILLFIGT